MRLQIFDDIIDVIPPHSSHFVSLSITFYCNNILMNHFCAQICSIYEAEHLVIYFTHLLSRHSANLQSYYCRLALVKCVLNMPHLN